MTPPMGPLPGTLELLVLRTLGRGSEMHGFEILEWIRESTDEELLVQEGIGDMDLFVAVTNNDENNIMSSLLAKRLGAKILGTSDDLRSYRLQFDDSDSAKKAREELSGIDGIGVDSNFLEIDF